MKRSFLIFSLIILSSMALAQPAGNQNLDTVVFTSTANYPDSFIAQPVSETVGAPLLLTERDNLPEASSEVLENLNVNEAVLIGGPAVISESTEKEIASEVNRTTRLWGTTRIGTSVEVSSYFWPESDEATIVQYPRESGKYSQLAEASEESGSSPMLISKEGTLSASVLSEVSRLGATDVTVYSDNPVNVTQDLRDIGVTSVDIEELDSVDRDEKRSIFVAAPGFREALTAASARGKAFIVRNEGMIPEAVSEARKSEEKTLKVTGEPDLASKIAERIRNQTDKEVRLLAGEPADVSANMTSSQAPEWLQEQRQKLDDWKKRASSAPGLKKAANRSIERASSVINENSSSEARNLLKKAESSYREEDYFESRNLAMRAFSESRSNQFGKLGPEEIRQRVQDEREDFREAAREIRELGREQARELREADSLEERLEIIRGYREERREAVEDLGEKARDRERRERTEAGERFRQDSGDPDDIGNSRISLEVEGSEVKAEARYTAEEAGYTGKTGIDRKGSNVNFELSLNSPDGPAAQAVSEYRLERKKTLETGNYTVSIQFRLDGETEKSMTKQITVPSNREYEQETDSEKSETDEEDSAGNTVTYTDSGFKPSKITVEKGEEVTWRDQSSRPMWVASDRHPSHTNYDGTSRRQHCENGDSSTFDQCSTGEKYVFEFEKTGSFGYHNHEFSSHGGKVVVE